ncbi:11547_t:CDS:2 [Dentiscutata erythropus]|uniref:11547_t:CDS:1 n=1 Tax=Dentiscutata erythropus TaxID=1348616 RepID=A0A9N9IGZ3_9GLOM|nr:11547_t:CDS:2 [Dentiscutata erythropus]
MPTQFLKTYYRRGANVLTPERSKKSDALKIRSPHNNKHLQQSGEYVLADMLPKASSPSETDSKKKKTGGTKPKEKSRSKSIRISKSPVTQMPPLELIQPFSMNLESSDINKEELCTSLSESEESEELVLELLLEEVLEEVSKSESTVARLTLPFLDFLLLFFFF